MEWPLRPQGLPLATQARHPTLGTHHQPPCLRLLGSHQAIPQVMESGLAVQAERAQAPFPCSGCVLGNGGSQHRGLMAWGVTWHGVSHGMVCHTAWCVIWHGVSHGMVCHTAWCVIWHGVSHGMVCHMAWCVARHGVSHGMVCHMAWCVTRHGVSHGMVCHMAWYVTWHGVSHGMVWRGAAWRRACG